MHTAQRRRTNRDYDRERSTRPWRKWYHTPRWRAIRKAQLLKEPYCCMCIQRGVSRIANVCNHVDRHHGDAARFWSGPFNSMCRDCHDTDQQRIEHGGVKRMPPNDDGWPAS